MTILASGASITGKVMALDDVQIVNGLQTSFQIYNHFYASDKDDSEDRSLLCRIVVTNNSETRDKIIKATNFQTAVSAASLRATDQIQRDIETFLLNHHWFYDRRKNYYKNQGRPADRVVRIEYLTQAVMAIALGRPDDSRARPTTLIKNDLDRDGVFDIRVNLRVYLFCLETMKLVEEHLKARFDYWDVGREFRFHVATELIVMKLGRKPTSLGQLVQLLDWSPLQEELGKAADRVAELAWDFVERREWPFDRAAKSKEFVHELWP